MSHPFVLVDSSLTPVDSEAMLLGKKLGLDQQILGDIINTSTGQSWASSVRSHRATQFLVPTH